jgi:hypothetical protein
MLRFVLIAISLGLAGLAAAADHPTSQAPVSARQTMLELIDALTKHDIAAARRMSLSYEEYAALSVRKPDKEDFQERVEGFFQGISRELSTTVELKEAGCADMLIVPPGKKTRRELVMAIIHATFQVKGKPSKGSPIPFVFISQGGKWKFFLRK